MAARILSVGEILFDVFPDRRKLGGAPANFACMAHRLGAIAHLVSRVGNDADGRLALEELSAIGLPTDSITVDPSRPTGTVDVVLNNGQPSYTIRTDVAWDAIVADERALHLARRCDAVCFGTLAQRSEPSRSAIRQVVSATPPATLRVLDINLRKPLVEAAVLEESLKLANVLKLNHEELPVVADLLSLSSGSTPDRLAELSDRLGCRLIVLTRGDAGSVLYARGEMHEHPGVPVQIVDAVGAGDAFTAATTLGFLRGWPLEGINNVANQIAAYVCTQPGATPAVPTDLRKYFEG